MINTDKLLTDLKDFLLDYENDPNLNELRDRCQFESEIIQVDQTEDNRLGPVPSISKFIGNSSKDSSPNKVDFEDIAFPSMVEKAKFPTVIQQRTNKQRFKTFLENHPDNHISKSIIKSRVQIETNRSNNIQNSNNMIEEELNDSEGKKSINIDILHTYSYYFPHNNLEKINDKLNKRLIEAERERWKKERERYM